MILHFWALHLHLKDDRLKAYAGWNRHYLYSYFMIAMILAVGAIDASDSGGGEGLIVALLICSALWKSLLYMTLQMMYAMLLMFAICSFHYL